MNVVATEVTGGSLVVGKVHSRTLIVDDHELFRKGLRELLEGEPGIEVLAEAVAEDEAFKKFQEIDADLVTVDVSLAAGHGMSLVARIKKCKPTCMILVISMYDERVFAERAIAAGASGYVSKQSSNQQILTAIRAVRDGQIYLRPDIMQSVLTRKTRPNRTGPNLADDQLSDREAVILSLIGQGCSTNQIAAELHLAVSTVETYRERIKTKLGLSSGAELIRYAVLWLMHSA